MCAFVLATLNARTGSTGNFRGDPFADLGGGLSDEGKMTAATTNDFRREGRYPVNAAAFTTESPDVVNLYEMTFFFAFHTWNYRTEAWKSKAPRRSPGGRD